MSFKHIWTSLHSKKNRYPRKPLEGFRVCYYRKPFKGFRRRVSETSETHNVHHSETSNTHSETQRKGFRIQKKLYRTRLDRKRSLCYQQQQAFKAAPDIRWGSVVNLSASRNNYNNHQRWATHEIQRKTLTTLLPFLASLPNHQEAKHCDLLHLKNEKTNHIFRRNIIWTHQLSSRRNSSKLISTHSQRWASHFVKSFGKYPLIFLSWRLWL